MTAYAAPLADMRFVLRHLVGLDRIAALPGKEETTPELVEAVLEEAGRLAAEVIAPLNAVGDREGARLENGVVRTAPGFREAYAQYRDGGWNALPFEAEWGGQDLPWAVAMAVSEMWQSASLAFGLCPVLNQGAVEALQAHGSDEQKRTYLPKLVSGVWTGTMNLTEPQAGSDVGAVRTKAERQADGSYRITGQKIFITYGDHDMAENIVHLVLARTPDAPAGIKGISLFLVPKLLPDADGNPGERNDLRCVSLEHKLGIHASPTCVMAYGDAGGATGFLIGQENRGIEYMFTMMNNARLTVGLQGVAIAERATQAAEAYAATRVQGKPIGADNGAPIAAHPDVRRMLLSMRCLTDAARALTYSAGAALDLARGHPDPAERAKRAGPGRPADTGGEGLEHGCRLRGRLDRHPGAWRHGLYRGDRRRPVPARRPDHPDLRGHQRHPGQRPGVPQGRARRRRGGAGAVPGDGADPGGAGRPSGHGADPRPAGGEPGGADGGDRLGGRDRARDPGRRRRQRGALSAHVRPGRRRLADGSGGAGR